MKLGEFWDDFRGCISFLSILPVRGDHQAAARAQYLFSLTGILLGFISLGISLGIIYAVHLSSPIFGSILFGILGWGFLILINGAHHLDGLLDLGDGLMFRGSCSQRYSRMADPRIGTGGFCLGLIVVLLSISGMQMAWISIQDPLELILKLSWMEGYSKSCMLIPLMLAHSRPESSIGIFRQILMDSPWRFWGCWGMLLGWGLIISMDWVLILKLIGAAGMLGYLISRISLKLLDGITGDCLGALHEISRMVGTWMLILG